MSEPAPVYIGKWRVAPTSRGELRWKNERWGVRIFESEYRRADSLLSPPKLPRDLPELRLPWSVVMSMIEESPSDV